MCSLLCKSKLDSLCVRGQAFKWPTHTLTAWPPTDDERDKAHPLRGRNDAQWCWCMTDVHCLSSVRWSWHLSSCPVSLSKFLPSVTGVLLQLANACQRLDTRQKLFVKVVTLFRMNFSFIIGFGDSRLCHTVIRFVPFEFQFHYRLWRLKAVSHCNSESSACTSDDLVVAYYWSDRKSCSVFSICDNWPTGNYCPSHGGGECSPP